MTKKLFVVFLALGMLFSFLSCKKQADGPVTEVSSYAEQAEICGFSPLQINFDGYTVSAYRTVYGIVAETEYAAEDEKRAVLRMADAGYNVQNMSGFADMGLRDVYTYEDGREFEIETRDGVLAVEWEDEYGGAEYRFSLAVFGGTLTETRIMLKSILTACKEVTA